MFFVRQKGKNLSPDRAEDINVKEKRYFTSSDKTCPEFERGLRLGEASLPL